MSTPILQLAFLGLVLVTIWTMKGFSLALYSGRKVEGRTSFLFTPLPSLDTWRRCASGGAAMWKKVWLDFIYYLAVTGLAYGLYWTYARYQHPPRVLLSYLAVIPALYSMLIVGPLAQLMFLPLGILLPAQHRNPVASASVAEFWGSRWNIWIGDWYKQAIFRPLRRSPLLASLATFLFSGVLHDLLINAPSFLLYGRNFFGPMTLYFLLQWLGIVLDRKLLHAWPRPRRAFAWIVVVAPAPLFFNEPMLRIIFLWPY